MRFAATSTAGAPRASMMSAAWRGSERHAPGAKIVDAKGAPHVVMISRPKLTTQLIVKAARSIH
jgi:hypothetical protein